MFREVAQELEGENDPSILFSPVICEHTSPLSTGLPFFGGEMQKCSSPGFLDSSLIKNIANDSVHF